MIKWAFFASQARKVDKIKVDFTIENEKLSKMLDELAKDAKQHGYTLWHKEDNTYFWENRYCQIANYPTLAEAVVAYGTETIDFGA